jgi:hypothetical protein
MIKVDENTYAITIIRGDSGYVTVPLVEVTEDEHGQKVETPYTMQEGETLRFAAAKKWGALEDECFIIRQISPTDMKLYFYPEDTKSQKFGEYKYDLEFVNSDGYVDTILKSALIISEEVF